MLKRTKSKDRLKRSDRGSQKSHVIPAKAELFLTEGKKSFEKTILIIKRLRVKSEMTKTLFRQTNG